MAIGASYITTAQVKTWMNLQGTADDAIVDDVVIAISRDIEDWCHRQFNKETVATARVYDPISERVCLVDDFYTTTDLVIASDDDGDGVFETVWTTDDYELRPLNGVRNGRTGFPFWEIRKRQKSTKRFHDSSSANVQVTARWGWTAVPDSIFQVAKLLAADTFQLKDSRMGIAGSDQFGTVVRVRDSVVAKSRLKNYVRGSVFVA